MKNKKVHSLTGQITPTLMEEAFDAVNANQGAPGIDGMSLQRYSQNLEQNLQSLMKALKNRTYHPEPLRRVYIPKPDGGKRPLGIPTIRDRIAQEVIRRLLEPIFEPIFHHHSYGFRPKRGCHMAVEHILKLKAQGYTYVLDADIKGFFDNIPHPVIMRMIAEKVADGNILTIVEKFLKAGVFEDGQLKPTTSGTPQGGVVSPLIANIVLNRLDWALANKGFKHIRYADDFVVLCREYTHAEKALDLVKTILDELGLTLSVEKTRLTSFKEGFDFLGFHLSSHSVSIRTKSIEKFKAKARIITRRCHNLDMFVIKKLNDLIRGTAVYFNPPFATIRTRFLRFDEFVRKRIRMMKFKRIWHTDNYRMKNKYIRKLGLLFFTDFLTTSNKCVYSSPCD